MSHVPEIDFGHILAMGSRGLRETFEQSGCKLVVEDPAYPDAMLFTSVELAVTTAWNAFWTLPNGRAGVEGHVLAGRRGCR